MLCYVNFTLIKTKSSKALAELGFFPTDTGHKKHMATILVGGAIKDALSYRSICCSFIDSRINFHLLSTKCLGQVLGSRGHSPCPRSAQPRGRHIP